MPSVKVESPSKHSPKDTFSKIRGILENDKDLRSIDSNYTCKFDDAAMTGKAKGNKFEADLKVTPAGTGSQVEIVVSLPLMMTPFKGMVQSKLQGKLDTALA
jgi:hypothetical protein